MRQTSLQHATNIGEFNPCESLRVLARDLLDRFSLGIDLSDAEVLILEPIEPFLGGTALDGLFDDLECLRSFPTTHQTSRLDLGVTDRIAERLPELRLDHAKSKLAAILGLIDVVSG